LQRTNGNVTTAGVLFPHASPEWEIQMPLIILWVGIPVVLLGGGYFIVHAMH
jgi:hypothetical protein